MRQRIVHGAEIETATPAEILDIVQSVGTSAPYTRIRASAAITLDATGSGTAEVYKCPIGYDFSVRRLNLDLSSATDVVTGAVALNVAGTFVAYRSSGALLQYGIPLASTAISQVPGVETWGFEEGPTLRNGDVLEVQAKGLTAGASFEIKLEGLLWTPRNG